MPRKHLTTSIDNDLQKEVKKLAIDLEQPFNTLIEEALRDLLKKYQKAKSWSDQYPHVKQDAGINNGATTKLLIVWTGQIMGRTTEMKKINNVVNFDSKFLAIEGDSVYVRFDFCDFYEWYKYTDKTFSLLDVVTSKDLEKSLENYETSKKPNVIYLGETFLKNWDACPKCRVVHCFDRICHYNH